MVRKIPKPFLLLLVLHASILRCLAQTVIPSFLIPDTVCVNAPVTITNTSTNASSFFWNFCVGDIQKVPTGVNLGSFANLAQPVFMDYAYDNGNYYAFVMNHSPGRLVRLDFGNSLLNTPTSVNLGDFGGIIPVANGSEGIQIVFNQGKWYAIIVGGNINQGTSPRVLKVEFGASLGNPNPTATDWGNIGNLAQPIDLHVFQENNRWYGFTVNAENNTITRFDFTGSFNNTPTAINLGNLGGIGYPTGIYAINDNGFWRVFITNCGNNVDPNAAASLTRLDFGSSLLNNPTGINLGNPGNLLKQPRDLTIMRSCGQIFGFAVNGRPGTDNIVRINFNGNLASVPTAVSLGNIGQLSFPHSISKLFRVQDNIYGFITNVSSNTITRIEFSGCSNATIPSFQGANPPAISYNQPGIYNINLTVDDGLPSQSSVCKQITVLPEAHFSFTQNVCQPQELRFSAAGNSRNLSTWDFGDNTTAINSPDAIHVYPSFGSYQVQLTAAGTCSAKKNINISIGPGDVILTRDTLICDGSPKRLRSAASLDFCWSPTTYLDDRSSPNPTTSTPNDITYYLNARVTGSNLISNGDFEQGLNGFTSEYSLAAINTTEGEYTVSNTPVTWNGSLQNCPDHSTGNGNMMLVNGSPSVNVNVWKQTVTVTPNTSYAFSAWIQSLFATNPASLQFSINGQTLGDTINASSQTCKWSAFNASWNSGSNTTAVISIVNKNSLVQGNDFALDDLFFAPVTVQYDSVVIKVDKVKVTANADTMICPRNPVQLSASGANTYSWTPAATLSNANIANPVATPDTTTSYIVTATAASGCTAKDTVQITLFQKPSIGITPDTLVCRNSSTQLQASGGLTYKWSPAAGLDNSDIPNPTAITFATSTYKVRVTDANSCFNEDSVTLSVLPYPQFAVIPEQVICNGSTAQLHATGGDEYSWQPSTSVSDPFSPEPFTKPENSSEYQIHIRENTCGFDTIMIAHVTVRPIPQMIVEKSNDINCNTPTAKLSASGASNYLWTPATGLDSPQSASPEAAIDTTTTYQVTGFNEYGCSSTQSIMVLVGKGGLPRFVVPNAFTPNNDGKNDCFGIKRWGNAKVRQFSVYNRYGQLIFQTGNPAQCWDGTFNGKPQDSGVYPYIIRASTLCGEVTRKGMVTLIR